MNLLGIGNTAEVFESQNGTVCKLFFEGYPHEYVELEFQNAKEIYRNKINIPKPLQTVTIENREGILYEKIEGRTLLQVLTEAEETQEAVLDGFVCLHRDILKHRSKSVLSYKQYLIAMLKNKKVNNRTMFDKLIALPDDNHLLHGDFHPNNVLVKQDGTLVAIDFMNVCSGPVLYDIARTYFIIKQYHIPLANRYIEKMGVREKELSEYLGVIEFCREQEG